MREEEEVEKYILMGGGGCERNVVTNDWSDQRRSRCNRVRILQARPVQRVPTIPGHYTGITTGRQVRTKSGRAKSYSFNMRRRYSFKASLKSTNAKIHTLNFEFSLVQSGVHRCLPG